MKKAKLLLLVLFLFVSKTYAQITNPAPYCTSQSPNNYNMLGNVKVNGTSQSLGAEGTLNQPTTYKYYNTTIFPDLTIGANTTIEILSYTPDDLEPMYYAVYIDLNHNNIFDANEVFMQNNNTTNAALNTFNTMNQTLTKTFQIPATALTGMTRMRVLRGTNPTNTYVYNNAFTLPACTPGFYGCTYDFNVTIAAGGPVAPPVTAFTASTTVAVTNTTTVTLTDQSTGAPTTWAWTITPNTVNYQAGTSATSQNPQIKFTAAGVYTIKLKATNTGGSDSLTKVNYIMVSNPIPMPPVAAFTASQTSASTNVTVITCNDQSSNNPTNRIWTFTPNTVIYINGTSNTSTNPQIAFSAAGNYSVKLWVSNPDGIDSLTKINYISVTDPVVDTLSPVCAFFANQTHAEVNATILNFTDASTKSPTSRLWTFTPGTITFVNGTTETSANPQVKFSVVGNYQVKLRVANASGSDSLTKPQYIVVTPTPTGIDETTLEANNLTIFPNPTNGYIQIQSLSKQKITAISITNIEGKVLMDTKKSTVEKINIANYARGTYFLKIRLGDGSLITKKINKI